MSTDGDRDFRWHSQCMPLRERKTKDWVGDALCFPPIPKAHPTSCTPNAPPLKDGEGTAARHAGAATGCSVELRGLHAYYGKQHAIKGIDSFRARARKPHPPAGERGAGPTIEFARSNLAVPWSDDYASLLELAEASDVPVRWSCRTGVCHNCETTLIAVWLLLSGIVVVQVRG
jgi:hypothetical protein